PRSSGDSQGRGQILDEHALLRWLIAADRRNIGDSPAHVGQGRLARRRQQLRLTMKSTAFIFAIALLVASTRADVKPAAMFSDHMVIQQGVEAPVWGWADPGENVTVSIGSQHETTKAGPDGKWMVRLAKHQAGETLEMAIKGNNEIKISDILVGEVWI